MKRVALASCLLALAALGCPKEDPQPSSASASAEPASKAPAAPSAAASTTSPTAEKPGGADRVGEVEITPIHHATLLLRAAGKAIYFDPVHDAKYDGLPKADLVFLTDIHPDHLDAKGLAMVAGPDTPLVVPPAVAEKLGGGFNRVIVVKNGEKTSPLPSLATLTAEAVPMYNLKRGPQPGAFYHDRGRGNGYVLSLGGERIYVSGDTECVPEMKALKDIDVAFVCMNLPYTMPPSEAAECVNAFRPKVLYPYHYRGSDLAELTRAVTGPGVEVRVRDWYAP
jgi:L-ascorbate metabolism protein UlaG (beta-lactamase superfamily)